MSSSPVPMIPLHSETRSRVVAENGLTLPPPPPGPRLDASVVAGLHARAMQRVGASPAEAPGYRVYWIDPHADPHGERPEWRDLRVDGDHLVFGRHTKCNARANVDPTLSLRHLLAATISVPGGTALRLLDLQTNVPFYLEDSVARRSILVSGAMAVRVGAYVVGAVPITQTPDGLQVETGPLPDAQITDAAGAADASDDVPLAPFASPIANALSAVADHRDVDRPRGGPYRSRITSIPAARSLTDLQQMLARVSHVDAANANDAALARVTLSNGKDSATAYLSAEALDRGVLVGRANRCLDEGLRRVLDDSISRVHLLLLRRRGTISVFDLCSMQGTFNAGEPIRRIEIASAMVHLFIGRNRPVSVLIELRRPADP